MNIFASSFHPHKMQAQEHVQAIENTIITEIQAIIPNAEIYFREDDLQFYGIRIYVLDPKNSIKIEFGIEMDLILSEWYLHEIPTLMSELRQKYEAQLKSLQKKATT